MSREAPAPPAEAKRSWSIAALIATLAMLGPFSIDAYLPAFAAIRATYDVPSIAVQQTLSIYLLAYAAMMLCHGALSDALGRRPVVLANLVVFAVATLGCMISGNIESLLLFRALQGLCAGAPLVIARADFLLLALVPALNFSPFFLYIAVAPAYLVDLLGVSTYGFAWLFVPMIMGITLMLLDLFPTMRGLASSLQGFLHFSLSAVNAGTIAPFLSHSLWTLALGMTGFTLGSFALWLVYQRRSMPIHEGPHTR